MRQVWIIPALMASLSGCANLGFEPPPEHGPVAVRWPTPKLKTYSQDFVDQLAADLSLASPNSPLRHVTADYYSLRRQVCAIEDSQEACRPIRDPNK